MKERNNSAKILVADDEEYNLKLYSFNLHERGYEVITAQNGKEAVDVALSESPDTILLDVMMPVMDGLTACKILKNDTRSKDIPIIIVSAKNSIDDIINGLKAGANEYLTKPFHIEELLLRVKSMVTLKETLNKLQSINRNLEEEVERKTNQLLEASRFEMLGKMASGLGHDLNNLLTGIFGYNRLAAKANDLDQIKQYIEKQNNSLTICQNFIMNLLNFSKVQKPHMTYFSPKKTLETTAGILLGRLKHNIVSYEIIEENESFIYSDEGHFSQICLNIVSNALDAMPDGGKLLFKISSNNKHTSVSIADTGSGIEKQNIDKIFDYLFTTKAKNKSTGIGLFTTKKIIEKLSGTINVQSELGKGTVFTITLPNCET